MRNYKMKQVKVINLNFKSKTFFEKGCFDALTTVKLLKANETVITLFDSS